MPQTHPARFHSVLKNDVNFMLLTECIRNSSLPLKLIYFHILFPYIFLFFRLIKLHQEVFLKCLKCTLLISPSP